jgi:hypothetical protein
MLGHHQIELEEESREITTHNTQRVIYIQADDVIAQVYKAAMELETSQLTLSYMEKPKQITTPSYQ